MAKSWFPQLEILEDRCVPATFTVKNLNDAGNGSLRQAVLNSNATSAVTDTIVFKTGLKGTINLASQIDITDDVTIKGPGAGKIKISGQDAKRIFFIDDGNSGNAIDVRISKLTLMRGAADNGGAISTTDEALTLTKCIFSDNHVSALGGTLYASAALGAGSVTISGCQFLENSAAGNGGAVHTNWPLEVRSSKLIGNWARGGGGAIYSDGGATTIENSTLRANVAGQGGGLSHTGGDLEILRSTIADNIAADIGGGLFVQNSPTATIASSTISGNTSLNIFFSFGGAITSLDSNLLVQNSTVSSNTSFAVGGGIFARNTTATTLTIQNSTIVYNRANLFGGGIFFENMDAVVQSSIIARNLAVAEKDWFSTNPATDELFATNSLIEDAGTIPPPPPGQENVTGVDPRLGALKKNGGPTQTHALRAGSPAINAGSNPAGLTTDQRGGKFKRVKGGITDIGAFER